MKQYSDSLILFLIDDEVEIPEFKSQKDIEEFFGEPVPFTLEEYLINEEYFWDYLKTWKSNHDFKIIEESEWCCDRYKGNVEVTVIYLLDNKYYSTTYTSYLQLDDEITIPPKEVKPIKEIITKYIEV